MSGTWHDKYGQRAWMRQLTAQVQRHHEDRLMGLLLPKHRPASWYDPGRFWSGDQLGLVPPFGLAPEVAVSL